MPKTTQTITIFLASPGDVSEERELIARTIAEWNQIRGRNRSTSFELLRWETNVSVGFGEDGQDVINGQIGDDYDAIIAVFWTRLGTETPRAASGSVEEYERALGRRRAGQPVEIAFLFKDAPISVKNVDLEQVQAVEALKLRLQKEGAFYKSFTDSNVLRFEVNLLLDRLARQFTPSASIKLSDYNPDEPSPSETIVEPESSTDLRNYEIGFIDVSESLEKHSEESQKFLAEMTAHLNEMTATSQSVSSEMEELAKLGSIDPGVIKPLVARVTDGMNRFSEFMEANLPNYSKHSRGIADDTRSLIDLSRDFETPQSDIVQLEENLETLHLAMTENYDSMIGVLQSTEGLQRMTVAFNHARRRLADNLRTYLADLKSTRDVVQLALEEIRQLRS